MTRVWMRTIHSRSASAFFALALCCGAPCIHRTNAWAQKAPSDSAVVAAIVNKLKSESSMLVRLDPVPIDSNATGVEAPLDSRMTRQSAAVAQRLRTAKALGVDIGDAFGIPACAGVMNPYSPATLHKECPSTSYQVIALSLPRPADNSTTTWRARGVLYAISRYGSSALGIDYVLERTNAGWKVAKSTVVSFVE